MTPADAGTILHDDADGLWRWTPPASMPHAIPLASTSLATLRAAVEREVMRATMLEGAPPRG